MRLHVTHHRGIGIRNRRVDQEIVVIHHQRNFPADRMAALFDRAAHPVDVVASAHVHAFEIEKQDVALGVVAHALGEPQPEQRLLQLHRLVAEDSRFHRPRIAHDRGEFHLCQDIAANVDAGRDLDQLHAFAAATEHAAFGDIQDRLSALGSVCAVEGDLLDLADELLAAAFADDPELAVLDGDLEPAGGEGAGEDQPPCVLADVDETAGAGEARPEAAHVDISFAVDLRHAQASHIQAAAVVEVCGAEVESALRHAADDTGLSGEREMVEHGLFVGDRRDALGHADAQIHDTPHRQLESAAPRDDLALVEQQGLERVERDAEFAGERRAVARAVSLVMVLGARDDDTVDQYAGNLDLARVQRARGGDALDLRDDEAVGILRRHRQRQIVERQRLVLHGDVAGQVRSRAAKQRHRDRKGLVEKPLLAVELDDTNEVFGRRGVDAPALDTRVDKSAQPHLGQRPGAMARDVAEELRQRAEGQVVGLDAIVHRERAELGHQAPVTADHALDQAVVRESIQPLVLAVAGSGGEDERQIPGRTRSDEARLERVDQLVRRAAADEAGRSDGVAVANDRNGVGRGDDLVLHPLLRRDGLAARAPATAASSSRKSLIRPIVSSAINDGA